MVNKGLDCGDLKVGDLICLEEGVGRDHWRFREEWMPKKRGRKSEVGAGGEGGW